ncbi:helix-turn-helix domain-containing protein [Spirosoma linguale]|uniref:Transcriptional regulator, XRE family n=1 Tax=Spirosoma linguale (strain ATCC 33905 / DSM 74 / LMG 10896 / Claus 1) TaxID=504472 RepID=D2QEV1_SPILD|nr:transcriptional regulator, XRE family [Spirosoma linguale DSM 74]
MTDIKQITSTQIRDARKAKGLTQKELAEKLGVSESTVNQYESGKQNLTIDTLVKIANALGMKFSTLLS